MASIDIEKLLEPIADELPCGPNLEYDAEFLNLERIAQGKPEQRMGDSIRAAEPPDFDQVLQQAAAVLARSKDLRVAVLFARALCHQRGFPGLSDGLALIAGLLDRYLPTVHPQLDPEESNDATMRITAIAGLCAADILAALRSRPIIVSRSFGPVSLRDFAVAAGNAAPLPDAPKLELSSIEAAFQEVDLPALKEAAAAIKSCAKSLAEIEALFDRETSGQGPELGPLLDIVRQAQHAVGARLERRVSPDEIPQPSSEAQEPTVSGGAERVSSDGAIRSREDVVRALDRICEYYAAFEPSSPLPLLLKRSKRLVSMSFLDIMREIAPDGVSQVESIAGKVEG
ncbi:MAG: type VI secretion system protein TssA [Polyangiaceae bacterium]